MFAKRNDEGLYHSDIIPLERYDTYEEEHPFYLEMHECMLDQFRTRVNRDNSRVDILEVGAGTGHFTKRLAQQPYGGMKLRALEPDPGAIEYLQRKVRGFSVDVVEANFLSYDAPTDFDFIFSCFSDHHIKPGQASIYFKGIAGNLREGGSFVVGDEFLRSHEPNNDFDYESALEAYHLFIIDEAKKRHRWELVKLEEAALESGRPKAAQRIDFKTSLDEYLRSTNSSGLQPVFQACISPQAVASKVGGMFVLVFQKLGRS